MKYQNPRKFHIFATLYKAYTIQIMNITRENKDALSVYLKLELLPEDYQEKVAGELRTYRQKVQMKGFRQGQVPPTLIKKMYGKAILIEQINKLMAESVDNYIKENKLNIIGNALLVPQEEKESVMDFDNPGTFSVWFEIGLVPEFDIDLSKISVDGYQIAISDEMLNKHQDSLLRRYGTVTSPETAGETDTLSGELSELDGNDEVKEGGIHVHTSIAIDLIALKTIQKQFIGKKQEAVIDFEIQKAFKNKTDLASMLRIKEDELANISPKFRFIINSITHVEPAVLGEDLYKKAYPQEDIKDEAGFRQAMRNDIGRYYRQNTNQKFFVDTIDKIIEQSKFELPKEFLKRWILSESNRRAEEEKKDVATDIPESEMQQIERSLRWELIQNKLTEKYEIKVEVEDLRRFYKERVLSQYFPTQSADEEMNKRIEMFVDSMMKNKEEVKRVYDMVFEEKLTAVFHEKAKVKTKEVSMDDFVEIVKKDNEKKSK